MLAYFVSPGSLRDRRVLAALAVLDHVDVGLEPADLLEGGAHDAVDLDEEVEVAVGILDLPGCHGCALPYERVRAGP